MSDRFLAYAFDLDGTLVDTAQDIATALNQALATKGFKLLSYDLIRSFVGQGEVKLIEQTLNRLRLSSDNLEELHRLYVKNYLKINGQFSKIYPYGEELLQYLHTKKIKIGILTNKSEKLALPLLEKLNISKYFSDKVCGDTFSTRKPDPEGINYLMKKFTNKNEEFILVGDTKTDIKTAQAADCSVVVLTHGFAVKGSLTPYKIPKLSNFMELKKWIKYDSKIIV